MSPANPPQGATTRPFIAIAVALAAAVGLSACSAADTQDSVVKSPSASASPLAGEAPLLGAGDPETTNFAYTGAPQTITVPFGVGQAKVSLTGGGGSNMHPTFGEPLHGEGYHLEGVLTVAPGDVLTVAVGGRGGDANGNKSPGNGGWSISSPYVGGRGGSSHGSQTTDGSGGGGASVIEINGTAAVVAAGGGGEGGTATKGGDFFGGGPGGLNSGHDGNGREMCHVNGGWGGDSGDPHLDPSGGSASPSLSQAGGGGGGGGRYAGEGGDASACGAKGGGGGSSLASNLTSLSSGVSSTKNVNGSVSITWVPNSTKATNYVVRKEGAPLTQLLEVNGSKTDDGATVDVWRRTLDGNSIVGNQVWAFNPNAADGYGQLVNKATGKCLEANGTDGTIDQWTCIDNALNELWKPVSQPGGNVALQTRQDGTQHWPTGTYYLATKSISASVIDGSELTLSSTITDEAAWELSQQ